MNVLFDFNSSWYVLFFAFLGSWLILLSVRRRSQGRKEIKEQVLLALSGMFALALMEFFAVSTNLWNYTPGNWPVILWPTYFAAILFGYQLLRSIEGLLHRPAFASQVKREDGSAYARETR
jgi:phosphatidylglycerophosphate synthase